MNCRATEPLIPLFVEADLDATEMAQVAAHVAACAACDALAADFRASQSSLHALAAPAFDEAVLASIRTAVQREIARPTWAERLAAVWQWKLVWAAAACLLVIGLLLSWPLRPTTDRRQIVVQTPLPERVSPPSSPAPAPRVATNHRSARQPVATKKQLASTDNIEAPPAPSVTEPPAASSVLATAATPAEAEPEMLRMEFQTADPNIRIIWLTPKEPARTTPAAEPK